MEIGRNIAAPASLVWSCLIDTEQWPVWGPSVRQVSCDDRIIRAESHGRVQTAFGCWLPFRITDYEEGRLWRWQVAGVAATGHRVEQIDPTQCRLVFEFPAWAFPYGLVCALAVRRIAQLCEQGRSTSA